MGEGGRGVPNFSKGDHLFQLEKGGPNVSKGDRFCEVPPDHFFLTIFGPVGGDCFGGGGGGGGGGDQLLRDRPALITRTDDITYTYISIYIYNYN